MGAGHHRFLGERCFFVIDYGDFRRMECLTFAQVAADMIARRRLILSANRYAV